MTEEQEQAAEAIKSFVLKWCPQDKTDEFIDELTVLVATLFAASDETLSFLATMTSTN